LAGKDEEGVALEDAVRAHPEPDVAAEVLWEQVSPTLSIDQLGRIHWALELVGRPAESPRFFGACGRAGERPVLGWTTIPAGRFMMGSPPSEKGRDSDEGPQQSVTVTAFELATTVVTAEQYRLFEARHRVGAQPGLPAVEVSWWAARLFCAWLGARLPSEAEWEYACRAGTNTAYSFGDELERLPDYGWFFRNSGNAHLPITTDWDRDKVLGEWGCRVRPVGQKNQNPWGLFDMHGNVWEWCADLWDEPVELPSEPRMWTYGARLHVLRGGSWLDFAWRCRSAFRIMRHPSVRFDTVGFRPARFTTG
jgi:formylglycine-generating enzyme required for sulfatase activity